MIQAYKYVRSIWACIVRFLRSADLWILVVAFFIMHNLHFILQYVYPATGEPSMVWIYKTIFGLTRGSVVIAYSYVISKILFPKIYQYFKSSFNVHYECETDHARLMHVSLAVYMFFIVVFLVSVVTM